MPENNEACPACCATNAALVSAIAELEADKKAMIRIGLVARIHGLDSFYYRNVVKEIPVRLAKELDHAGWKMPHLNPAGN